MSAGVNSKPETKVGENGAYLDIIWSKDHTRRCSSKWLTVNCHCLQCKSSPGKHSIDEHMHITNPKITDANLQCSITDESGKQHMTCLPLDYLLSTCTCAACIACELKRRTQTIRDCHTVPYIPYERASSDGEGRFEFLQMMMDYGFCVIRDCPVDDKETILNFARSIGGIRPTLYGYDWIVSSHVSPTNAAYTAYKLPSHNDQIMYETSPGVQYLLALRFDDDVQGGLSFIVDGFKCAEILRERHPKYFKTLCRVPTTFDTIDMAREVPAWIWHSKPHFEVGYYGEIVAVNWHPGLESTLRVREEDIEEYYEAHKAFMEILRNPQNQNEFRLRQGDMMILNNQRVMHARTSFKSSRDGDRHLFGFYTNLDDLKCTYMELAATLNKAVAPPKIGNRSCF